MLENEIKKNKIQLDNPPPKKKRRQNVDQIPDKKRNIKIFYKTNQNNNPKSKETDQI